MANKLTSRTACRYLRDISDKSSQFKTSDGAVLKNLIDLACYLKSCDDKAFSYHVSNEHNHFANWVENVIQDKFLARQMSLVLSKNPMRLIVAKRINELVHNATRQHMPREKAAMILEDALLPEELFITNDGRSIRNLWELKEFLDSAKDHVVAYHISPTRNDFYDWISSVLMDMELAERIESIDDRKELARCVGERISQLEAFRAHKPRFPSLSEYINCIREE